MRKLILVQGISTKNDYISQELNSAGFDFSIYDKVKVIKTEEFFEKKTPWYIKPIKIIPVASGWANRVSDVLTFMRSKEGRTGACRMVRFAIQKAQKEGYTVDIAGHSLGTIIILTCGPNNLNSKENYRDQIIQVDKTYLFNSPLGMIFPFGGKVLNFVRRYIQNYLTKEMHYVYSTKDMVSKKYSEENQGQVLNLATLNKKEIYKEETSHSLKETCKAWLSRL